MKCLVDLVELYSRAVIFHNIMWVIQIVTSEIKWILLHLFYFNVHFLETLDLI